jgi:phosphoglycerate dehydrogenase-like enzyme
MFSHPPASPSALLLLDPRFRELVFDDELTARLSAALCFVAPAQTWETHEALAPALQKEVNVIVSTWGMPRMDADFLLRYPALRAVFYAGGSARSFVTPESWARGVRVVTATAANAIPVAEYVFAQTILCLKQVWPQACTMKAKRFYAHSVHRPPGAYRSTVGLIALGHVGRLVAQRLRTLEVKTIAYDPYVTTREAANLGVELCSLEEVFGRSDVVNCHLPELPETTGLLRARHFRAMRAGTAFVNTARGTVVHEQELIAVLRERADLFAVLDVTECEPPKPENPLYDLPNVLLTPHMAGSIGGECRRLGEWIVEDVERYVRGEPIANEITCESSDHLA